MKSESTYFDAIWPEPFDGIDRTELNQSEASNFQIARIVLYRFIICGCCVCMLSDVWVRFEQGLNKAWVQKHWNHGFIMSLYYAFSMQTQQPHIINPIQYNSGNLEIAGLWLVELCPVNPIKRFRSYSIVYLSQKVLAKTFQFFRNNLVQCLHKNSKWSKLFDILWIISTSSHMVCAT